MIRARRLVVLTAAAFLAATAMPAGATIAAGGTEPELHLETDVLTPGRSVAITGSRWPTGTTLQAVLCGANAVNGSADCVQAAAVTMSPGPNGVVNGVLQVLPPPQPCPCVVVVSLLATAKSITLPVQVEGVPAAPVPPASTQHQPQPLTVRARVTGGNSLGSVFGAPASRTLVLTVTNTDQSPVPNPVVSAQWGRKRNVDQSISVPGVGPLAPGESRRINIPFELDALSFGSYSVAGRVTGASAPVRFEEETSTWPWGLFVILLVVAQRLLLGLRNVLRRRLRAREARKRAATEPEPVPEAAGWEEDRTDDEWIEDDDWAEEDESTERTPPIEIHRGAYGRSAQRR